MIESISRARKGVEFINIMARLLGEMVRSWQCISPVGFLGIAEI
jgi:hypothetical protein